VKVFAVFLRICGPIVRRLLLPACLLAGAAAPAFAIQEGRPAPTLEARTLDGQVFRVAGADGHVTVVHFWATWCQPCRAEMPQIDAYYRAHRDEGLRVLAISMDDPQDDAAVRAAMRDFAFPAAYRRDTRFGDYGRIWRMPMSFVIDRDGILRKDGGVGDPLLLDRPLLDRIVGPLLGNGAAR